MLFKNSISQKMCKELSIVSYKYKYNLHSFYKTLKVFIVLIKSNKSTFGDLEIPLYNGKILKNIT